MEMRRKVRHLEVICYRAGIIYSIVESNDRISSRALTQTILKPFADCCAVMRHPVLTVMPVRILVGLANELACAVIVFDLVF